MPLTWGTYMRAIHTVEPFEKVDEVLGSWVVQIVDDGDCGATWGEARSDWGFGCPPHIVVYVTEGMVESVISTMRRCGITTPVCVTDANDWSEDARIDPLFSTWPVCAAEAHSAAVRKP